MQRTLLQRLGGASDVPTESLEHAPKRVRRAVSALEQASGEPVALLAGTPEWWCRDGRACPRAENTTSQDDDVPPRIGRAGGAALAARRRISLVELQQGQHSTGLFGYLVHRRALPLLLSAGALVPMQQQLDVAMSTGLEWGHGARWEAHPPLLTAPRSEHSGDTDVQLLERARGGGGGPADRGRGARRQAERAVEARVLSSSSSSSLASCTRSSLLPERRKRAGV